MAIFDFLRKRANNEPAAPTPTTTEEPATNVTSPAPATPKAPERPADDVLLQALLRGDQITRDQAMTVPAVSAAVDYISSAIAAMPIKLYKRKGDDVQSMDDDTRVKLLNGDTGDTLDAYQMKKSMVADYLMGQGGYVHIGKYRNEVTKLSYVPDTYVSEQIINPDPLHKVYKLFVYTDQYDLWEFIKILRNTQNGATGKGLTEEVAQALQTAYATLMYQLFAVQNGGNKKGFLKSQRKLGQPEIDALKKAWRNLYTTNSENVVVLNNGLEFQEASNSSVEMQLNQNKQTLTQEIKNIFHIYDDDYFRTFKEAIYPIMKALETALNRDLLLESEKKKHFFELDPKEILRVNIDERYKAYKLAKDTGFLTINEIRAAENLERIEGMDVINVGLASVLYDTNTHQYYTPNTDALTDPSDGKTGNTKNNEEVKKEDEKLIQEDIGREEYSQEQEEGNVE